ncbi:Ig-like domain-containing protein [Staphylococcus nepalensis]|uniref:Putative biofilm-associated protein n=11 Tax=Staphylococcus nepalensis TaxID=214473 RepID=A0A380GL68_9STAP|nr:Ig-like domain-containing protein [Staphylococcus nepalensis]SUM53978.1 putative biofilm-associated protein [Staphylococcus nepalensis]VDG65910.1 metallophosphoesterase [Lacrimispora indolis]
MKNDQGFLPNRLNKYAIRKFTVGTASLLIGATLVFGVSNEAQADELATIKTDEKTDNSDKWEALDVEDIKGVENNNEATNSTESRTTDTEEKFENTELERKQDTTSNEISTIETKNEEKSNQEVIDNEEKQPAQVENDIDEVSKETTHATETKNEKNSNQEKVIDNEEKQSAQVERDIDETSKETTQETTNENDINNNASQKETSESETSFNNNVNKKSPSESPKKEITNKTSSTASSEDKEASAKLDSKAHTTEKTKDPSNNSKQTASQENIKQSIEKANATEANEEKITDKKDNAQSKLTEELSKNDNKEATIKNYLNSQLPNEETQAILNDTDIDYKNATDEEINTEILKASVIQLANQQDNVKTLATSKRTMLRSMATPTALSAAVEQNEEVEKSLGYMDNYTFASLIFDPKRLDSQDMLDSNVIPFDIHSYMSGANSGNRYKIDLKLDPIISKHVTKITANPSGRKNPVEFIRLHDENGKLTNTWEVNFIRANGGLFGGAEILSQYTATNGKIELDDTVGNILNEAGNLDNNKLNYQIFVRDSINNKIVRTSESSGYLLTTADDDLVQLESNVSDEDKNVFKASSGSATYDNAPGEHGGFIIDQQIMKNGTFTYGKTKSKQWSYNYQIDKDLLPYIESAELHTYDYKGLSGFDKSYHSEDKVANIQLDSNGNGMITSDNLNKLIEFNNGLPETVGVRIVIKLNQSVNNILTKDAQYDDQGNLIRETTKQKDDFTFAGYLTDSDGQLINHTLGTSTLALQDYDKDGLLDRYERQVALSNPENEDTDGDGKNDGDEVINYKTSPLVGKPQAADITNEDTVVTGSVPLKEGAATQTAKVINENGKVIGSATVNADGKFNVSIPQSPEGTYTIAIDSPNYENDEVNTFNIIDLSKVPVPSINPVDDNDTEIHVNGTAGATVTVRDNNNNEIGSVQIPDDGSSATITLNQPLPAGTVLTAIASKDNKISEKSGQIIVTDETAPDAPVINLVASNDTQVTGTAEPNSTVTIGFPGGGKISVKADNQGDYTADIPSGVILKGGEVFKAVSIDEAGNESIVATTTVADKTAPDAPTLENVTSNSNQVTGQAEANATVKVTFPSGAIVETTADQNGFYTVAIPENEGLKGGETIEATATDVAGNVSESGSTDVIDKTAPDTPQISHVTSVSTEVTGKSEANATVKITFPSGAIAETIADEDGNFTVVIPESENLQGKETISATATDATGNVSQPSSTTVTDETAPAPPIVNGVTSEDTQITGDAEPNTTVTIKFPSGETSNGETDADGKYVVTIPNEIDLKGGEELEVTSTDDAGNETDPVKTIVKDKTAPYAPKVNNVTSEDKTISGMAEPGSTVTVTFPDNSTATGTADQGGNYSIEIPSDIKLDGGEALQVVATDKNDNISAPTMTTVEDTTAPDAPKINEASSEDTQIAGTSEPNSTVTVTFPGGATVDVETDEQGNFIVDIPENMDLTGGEEIQASAQDKSDNKSTQASTTVVDATAPEAPMVNEVTSEDKTIRGTAEPGSTVTITFPDGKTADGKANAQSEYSIAIPENVELTGGEELLVAAMDSNGNISDSVTTTVTDTTAPEAPTLDEVTSEDKTIRGTAEAGSTVTVTFPDGKTADGKANEQGEYSIAIPENVELTGGEELLVAAMDSNGNISDSVTTTVTDTTAPEVPTVNEVTSEDKTIRGTAEAGSTVTVTFPDGKTADGKANEQGEYSIAIPENVKLTGGEELLVAAMDSNGNISDSVTTTVTDTTAPEAPTLDEVTSDDTTVSGTSEPGSTVTVMFPDGTTATGTADDEGNYTIEIPSNVDLNGGEDIIVTAKDKAGNPSDSVTTTVTDTTAPEAPTVNEVTSEDTTVSGTSEPGSTVTVMFPDGTTATGTADEEGNYTIEIPTDINLGGGENITITAKDKAGNPSESATTTVTDTRAPEAPTVNEVTSEDKTIRGTAEAGSTVTVTFPDGTTGTGTADEEGNYTIEIPTDINLDGGENIIVTAKDKAGNPSESATTTVTDTTAPEAPTVNEVTSEGTTVSGTSEPGSTVTVMFPDGTTATGTADEEGNYTIEIPTDINLDGGENITVTAKDKAGNPSDSVTTTVTDTTAPKAPTVNEVTSEDKTIRGTAEAGSTVTVTFPDGTTVTDTADEEGNYTIEIPTDINLNGGENIIVKATDQSGNTSENTNTVVPGADKVPGTGEAQDTDETSDKGEATSTNEGAIPEEKQNTSETSGVNQSSNTGQTSKVDQNSNAEYNNSGSATSNSNKKEKDNVANKNNINKSELPKTGEHEENNATLFGSLFAGMGALLLFIKRRRKKEEDK